ncbi:MAG: hypothetical protein ACRC8Q_00595, partial [Aeromonas sp.]
RIYSFAKSAESAPNRPLTTTSLPPHMASGLLLTALILWPAAMLTTRAVIASVKLTPDTKINAAIKTVLEGSQPA